MRFFEVKVKVDRMMNSGAMKNVSEIYAVDAMTFTEAEARTTECVHTETGGVFEVIAEKRAKYDEVVFNDGEMFFLVKFIHTQRRGKRAPEPEVRAFPSREHRQGERARKRAHAPQLFRIRD